MIYKGHIVKVHLKRFQYGNKQDISMQILHLLIGNNAKFFVIPQSFYQLNLQKSFDNETIFDFQWQKIDK